MDLQMPNRLPHRDTCPPPPFNSAPNEARHRLEAILAKSLAKAEARGKIGLHKRKNSISGSIAEAVRLEAYERTDIEDIKRDTLKHRKNPDSKKEEPEKDLQRLEGQTKQEAFEWWQRIFKRGPLRKCLDYYDFDDDPLFARLYYEVQIPVNEVVQSNDKEGMQSRAFWNHVRSQLRDVGEGEVEEDKDKDRDEDEDEDDEMSNEWPDIVYGNKYALGLEESTQRNQTIGNLWKERRAFAERERELRYVHAWK